MRQNAALLSITLAAIFALGTATSRAQESGSPKAAEAPKPLPAYHLDFSLNELEGGKKINNRQYSMDLIALREGDRNVRFSYGKDLKIGTRVPVETDQGKMEYLDIGTKIYCMAMVDETGQITLDARAEVSSLVPRSDTDTYHPASRNPVVRQVSIQASAAVTPGKPTSLGTVDDPDSKRQFQLEVIVTKLR
jgi:hypothetical protein